MTVLLALTVSAQAQDYEQFRKSALEEYSAVREKSFRQYEDFRDKANSEFAEFIKKAWSSMDSEDGIKMPPKDPVVPPVVLDELEPVVVEDIPIVLDDVIILQEDKLKAPAPVSPIKAPEHQGDFRMTAFGAEYLLNYDEKLLPKLKATDENSISSFWKDLSRKKAVDGAISDLLKYREEQDLCDWAFFELAGQMSEQMSPSDAERATLLTFYTLCQSGFKVRIGRDAAGKLHITGATDSNIAETPYWEIEGERFFLLDGTGTTFMRILVNPFPGESKMRLRAVGKNKFSTLTSGGRNIQSSKYPELSCPVRANTSLVGFYSTYPVAFVGDDTRTRWYHYAMNPISPEAEADLYPAIRKAIAGKTELEAVNMILNFVQTGLEYEYDETIWGGDRTFFAEESLYYPYCDCEDRSILFSRIIRDVLGLKVALIYYPGHLATAVRFTSSEKGDHIIVEGEKFTVCDPTFINAPVGMTMTGMDNSKAYAILL